VLIDTDDTFPVLTDLVPINLCQGMLGSLHPPIADAGSFQLPKDGGCDVAFRLRDRREAGDHQRQHYETDSFHFITPPVGSVNVR
jgi:hypothetical protein